MPNIVVQYVSVSWSGGHTRQPRNTAASAAFTPIPGTASGPLTIIPAAGDSFTVSPPNPLPPSPGTTYTYAFTSVSDGASVGLISANPNPNPPLQFVAGANTITILYVYIASSGSNGGDDYGAIIDAFNESIGNLVDNDFVTVTPDPDGSVTNYANAEGFVDTTDSACTIVADHPNIGPYQSLPTNALFLNWVVIQDQIPAGVVISGANLQVPKKVTVYALAIYYNPKALKEFKEFKDKDIKEIKEKDFKDIKDKDKEKEIIADKSLAPDKAHHLVDKVPDTKDQSLDKVAQDNYKAATLHEKTTDKLYVGEFGKVSTDNQPPGSQGESQGFARQLHSLTQKISDLEAKLNTAIKGKAFIKEADRPAVGKAAAKKPGKPR